MGERIEKAIMIEKMKPRIEELRIGQGISIKERPIWFPFNLYARNTTNASVIPRPYNQRVQRAQYNCLKSGVVLVGDQFDRFQIQAV